MTPTDIAQWIIIGTLAVMVVILAHQVGKLR